MKLRRHFSPTTKYTGNSHLLERHFFAKCLKQFRCSKETTNVVVGFQKDETLIDDVLLVLFSHLRLAHLDQFYDPAWIEVHHEADAAAMLGQVFDRETQATRACWSK